MRYFRLHGNMKVPQIFSVLSKMGDLPCGILDIVDCPFLISSVLWMGGNFNFSLFPGCRKKEVLRDL